MTKSVSDPNLGVGFVLPPAGLAEDILGCDFSQQQPADLFAFADSLQNASPADPAVLPRRIETWVTFTIGGETYALPVTAVHEILRVSAITRVPHAPHTVRGLTNMRGKVLPVIELRVCLGLEPQALEPQNRVLVASTRGRFLGLLVDSVQQVERIDRDAVQPPPPDVVTAQSRYIIGMIQSGERLVILLDVETVLLVRGSMADTNLQKSV